MVYAICSDKRYWSGYMWVSFKQIHKAMLFGSKVEAHLICKGLETGAVVPLWITWQKPLSTKKFLSGAKSKTLKSGVVMGRGKKLGSGAEVVSHAQRVSR